MAEGRVPHSWVGRNVAVGLLEPAPEALRLSGMKTSIRPPSTTVKVGVLEAVTDLGIVGAFSLPDAEGDDPVGFYPWSAVLTVMPGQKGEVAEVSPIR